MKTLALPYAIATAISTSMISSLATADTTATEQAQDIVQLDVVTVSADFRDTDVQELPEAVTVIGADNIALRSAEHLESVLSFAPNVNFSSGSSRGRYFQIRGIGERSQFVDPVNPSVGLMIDGIDMTGLGGAATLFDVQQVEVLRGPQGTRFGANALAGMINIQTKAATKETEGYVAGKFGNYNTHGQSAAISGSIADNVQGRLAVNSFQSEGYMENEYLDKSNTNNLDEVVARGKIQWQPDSDSEFRLTYLLVDIDNGYDAFTLDSSRNSLADEVGRDSQDTDAFAISYDRALSDALILEIDASASWNQTEYSYDEDWVSDSYPPKWGTVFDAYIRDEQRDSIEIRLLSGENGKIFSSTTDWVAGIYWMERDQDLERNRTGKSQYRNALAVQSFSTYVEFDTSISDTSSISYGVRAEQWENDFSASDGVEGDTSEILFGGKVTLEQLITHNHLSYLSLARGYKPGGVNSDSDVSEDNRTFDTETNNTVEIGFKSSLNNDDLKTRLAVFYIQRENQQIKSSYFDPASSSFQDYLANAAKGENYGIEIESNWQLLDALKWDLSLGYLHSEFKEYEYEKNVYDASWNLIGSETVDKSGRSQAHAPEYSLATGLHFSPSEFLTLSIESEAKDEFYFSDSHDEKSRAYVIWHAQAAFKNGPFEVSLYGRNLTNKETDVRGFGGFSNDAKSTQPDDEGRYAQLGEPRLVGIEGRYNF